MASLHYKNGVVSVVGRVLIRDSASTTGGMKTGLTSASADLIIATIADNEAATTRYRANSSEIETIATLGTFAAPTAGKCRFKEVDATNHPGLYEYQVADARWAVTSARYLIVSIFGAAGTVPVNERVQFEPVPANVLQVLSVAVSGSTIQVRKAVALPNFQFPMYHVGSGQLESGKTVTATRSLDGAAFAACFNAPAENGTSGVYVIDLDGSDLNGDVVTLKFTAQTCDPTVVTIVTQS